MYICAMTVREFIENCKEDIDVYDSYDERCGVAFCPPQELTEEGKKRFERALGLMVEFPSDDTLGDYAYVICETEEEAQEVKELFHGMAGFCSCEDYARWFGGNYA